MKKRLLTLLIIVSLVSLLLCSCDIGSILDELGGNAPQSPSVSLDTIPEFDGKTPYVVINDNNPFFENEKTDESYESFSELDELGRCGVTIACIGVDIMPTEERGSIGHIKPSGWQTVKYDIVDGKYLYNRCHLIGFQLTGENDNEKNLITGTRFMNVDGMLPFENMVADYVKETENHVLYRVTPIYDGNNLVASGVLMEAKSVEDDEILFCVYVYNAQPGIEINYKNGLSALSGEKIPEDTSDTNDNSDEGEDNEFILNTSSKKFHKPDKKFCLM